jgi:hypothetical protein
MEAPEKLYIALNELTEDGHTFVLDHRVDYPICTEYTRTDAFIEKACVKLKKLMYDNLMFQGRLHREEVIDNFVEDFKNYIKGE